MSWTDDILGPPLGKKGCNLWKDGASGFFKIKYTSSTQMQSNFRFYQTYKQCNNNYSRFGHFLCRLKKNVSTITWSMTHVVRGEGGVSYLKEEGNQRAQGRTIQGYFINWGVEPSASHLFVLHVLFITIRQSRMRIFYINLWEYITCQISFCLGKLNYILSRCLNPKDFQDFDFWDN